jgi:flagellar hook assembly protein FlgD
MLRQLAPDGSLLRNYENVLVQYESKNMGTRSGILITVHSKKPLLEKKNSFGTAMIYDALGNVIMKSVELKKAYNSQEYALVWNGMNEKGRNVGSGTYLMFITITDIDGKTYVEKRRIGVKFDAVIGMAGK